MDELSRARALRGELAAALDRVPADFGGGSSVRKAQRLAWLICRYRLRHTVDVGVYRGRSFLPQALAHRHCTGGVAYGVDPWDAQEAQQHDQPAIAEELASWLARTDFDAIHRELSRLCDELGLGGHAVLVRATSAAAAATFAREGMRFGLVHVDGNHDAAIALADVERFVPLLRRGGLLVLDDVSWDSLQPARAAAGRRLRLVCEEIPPADDYAVYMRTRSPLAVWRLRRALARLG
jgi:hypothetical protein